MTSLLVTVLGPAGSLDLVVPAEAPIGALLDPLARLHGDARRAPLHGEQLPAHDWSLAPIGGDPLAHDRSLAGCGMGDGAVLVLSGGFPPDDTATAATVRRCAVVGVLSAAAGMGRTTVTALLAGALSGSRQGLTVAVDAHPGRGSLTERLAPDHRVTAADLLPLIDHPALTRDELVACLAWYGPRGALLPSRPSQGRAPPLDQRDWARLVRGLVRHSAALVLDCGPGLGDPGARAVMATADQVVVLSEPYPSRASRWLAQTLVDNGLPVVVVPTRAPPRLDTAALAGRLPGVRGVVPLAHHPVGQDEPAPSGTGVPTSWQAKARRLAELLVADWTALGIGATPADGARLPSSIGE